MWESKSYDKNTEELFLKQGKARLLARLLAQRKIDPLSVEEFIQSDYKGLSHPHALNDVDKAALLFCNIAKEKGRIAVIGDYDCDGIISSVMIKELCNVFNLDCSVFLPSRLDHGYGLNDETVKDFLKKNKKKPNLLFIVDCGTNSKDQVQKLFDSGIENIVIIDHHLPSESIALNASALISWHLSKSANGFKEMCSCGEVFQFIRGIRWLTKKVDPVEFLTYAAIGTIADVSSIMGDNRIIVKNGLTEYAINHVVSSGLKALMRQSKIYSKNLTQHDVAFKIAPRINAVGRVYSPDIVYGLLIERDPEIATNTAEYIVDYNEERKKIQKAIEDEAIALANKQNSKSGILVVNEKWHIGVVGIVASRLVELFNKPAIVVGKLGEVWKGSGRSVKGVNIKEILDLCPELFEAYGGHAGAVGVTLKPKMTEKAGKVFDKACHKYYTQKSIPKEVINYYDAKLDIKLITPLTSALLRECLYPYCDENNSEPIFMIPDATIVDTTVMEKEHWRLLTFFIERNGQRCPHPFKFFTKKYGTEIEGRIMNVLFSFPQHDNFEASKFSQFELYVTDIIPKEKG
jgi:single-stranded-DNA-specific exonuclease